MDRETKALIKAARAVLNYAGMNNFLANAHRADAFGIRANDLRKLRDAADRAEGKES